MYISVAYPPFLAGRLVCIGYHVGMAFIFVYIMSVDILLCYINGIVLICDWNDDVRNENILTLRLKKREEIGKGKGGVSPIGMEGCDVHSSIVGD